MTSIETKVLEAAGDSILRDLNANIRRSVGAERDRKLLQYMRNDRFWKGFHYDYTDVDDGGTIRWSSVSGNMLSGGQDEDGPPGIYDYKVNLYKGDALKFIGLLSRVPNAKCVPDRQLPEYIRRANIAQDALQTILPYWGLELQHMELMRIMWKGGVGFGYTPYVTDKDRYGTVQLPEYEIVNGMLMPARYNCIQCNYEQPASAGNVCEQCGYKMGPAEFSPEVWGPVEQLKTMHTFPNGFVEFYLADLTTVITPYKIKTLDDSSWLWYEYEQDCARIICAHKELADRYNDFCGYASTYDYTGQMARDQASSPSATIQSGDPRMWNYARIWIDRENAYAIDNKDARKLILDSGGRGIKITATCGRVIGTTDGDFRKCWAACKPTVDDYLYADPLGDDYISINQAVNDSLNIMLQTQEKGIPLTLIDQQVLNFESLRKRQSVLDMIPIHLGAASGKSIREVMTQTDPGKIPPATGVVIETGMHLQRESSGLLPSVWGGDAGREQTLGEAELKRNQGMMQHGIVWAFSRHFYSRTDQNAIYQLAEAGDTTLHLPSKVPYGPPSESEIPDLPEVLKGGWHVECEEGIPLTFGQARAQMMKLLELSGIPVGPLLGLDDPTQVEALQQTLGNDYIKIPGAASLRKFNYVVQQILELGAQGVPPIPGPDGFPQPQIPIDDFEDDHELMSLLVKRWSQEVADKKIRENNKLGYDGVIAWGRAHYNVVLMQLQAQAEAGQQQQGPPQSKGRAPTPSKKESEEEVVPSKAPREDIAPAPGV